MFLCQLQLKIEALLYFSCQGYLDRIQSWKVKPEGFPSRDYLRQRVSKPFFFITKDVFAVLGPGTDPNIISKMELFTGAFSGLNEDK